MKALTLFLVVNIVALPFANAAKLQITSRSRNPRCRIYNNIKSCDYERYPICGTNNISYKNPCFLCIENRVLHKRIRIKHMGTCRQHPPITVMHGASVGRLFPAYGQ
uniref:Trypsin inhibitor ClTI-1-like protein n=1 Tax=Callorhinchus milii TaxID=7868 RepID=V9LKE9_CALMI